MNKEIRPPLKPKVVVLDDSLTCQDQIIYKPTQGRSLPKIDGITYNDEAGIDFMKRQDSIVFD